MAKRNPEFDKYIAKSADFARPILKKLRGLFHEACPEIEETIKWGFPHFEYRGVLASMAAFKNHASFGFWKSKLLSDPHGLFNDENAMHGSRLTDVSQLPSDKILLAYIREAVSLNEQGVKVPKEKKPPKPELKMPEDLQAALKKNKKAAAVFAAFSPSNKRDYIEWLLEAKTQATRDKRLATAVEWIAEGKPRNWKYVRK